MFLLTNKRWQQRGGNVHTDHPLLSVRMEPFIRVRYISRLYIISCDTVAKSTRKPPVTSIARAPVPVTTKYESRVKSGSFWAYAIFVWRAVYFKSQKSNFSPLRKSENFTVHNTIQLRGKHGGFSNRSVFHAFPPFTVTDIVTAYNNIVDTYKYLLNAVYRTMDPATKTAATRFPIKKKYI